MLLIEKIPLNTIPFEKNFSFLGLSKNLIQFC